MVVPAGACERRGYLAARRHAERAVEVEGEGEHVLGALGRGDDEDV